MPGQVIWPDLGTLEEGQGHSVRKGVEREAELYLTLPWDSSLQDYTKGLQGPASPIVTTY